MATAIDGSSSVTNMYLWQPQQGLYYGPCADGDYDLPLIGLVVGSQADDLKAFVTIFLAKFGQLRN